MEKLMARIKELENALFQIAYPVMYLQEEAERENAKLDGVIALQLSNDANYLKEIARKALSKGRRD